jgi:predicted ABC-type ATPase
VPDQSLALFYGGTNGSGKSTLREVDDTSKIQFHIDPDAIARGINPLNPRSVDIAAGREALSQFQHAVNHGISFSMETTLTGAGIIKRMQEARDAGFSVELRYVGLGSPEKNILRVAERVAKGGHHIDDAVIHRRYSDSLANLIQAIKIAHTVQIRDNAGDFAVTHVQIEKGIVRLLTNEQPDWIKEVLLKI